MQAKLTNDLTVGKPFKVILRFALPMLISMVFQQMYNIMDSIIAGQVLGESGLAAVGASYPITMIFIAVASGASIGSSVVISQIFGAKEMNKLKSSITTTMISLAVLGAALTLIGYFICSPMLTLLNTDAEIFADSALYLEIYVYGLLFLFLYNAVNAVFNALGKSKIPLYLLIFSTLFNIALNLLFTMVLDWGIAGIAWATFIAQGIASLLALAILVLDFRKIKCESKYKVFDVKLLGRIAKNAVPSIMQQSFISVGQLFIQGLVNSFGATVTAGYAAAIKINTFVITTMNTLSAALSSYTAQNYGANRTDRIWQGTKATLAIISVIFVMLMLIIFVFSKQLIGLFIDANDSPQVIEVGVKFLNIVAPFYLIIMCKGVCDGVLRGTGALWQFMTATLVDLILRVILAFLLADWMHSELGIWWSWPLGWIIGAALAIYFFFTAKWRKQSLIPQYGAEPPDRQSATEQRE